MVSLLRELPSLSFRCPHCDTTSIVDLAKLFVPQPELKAFDAGHHSSTGGEANEPEVVNASKGPAVASPPSNIKAEKETQHPDAVFENGSSKHTKAANMKKSGASATRQKEETSVRNTMAPSSCNVMVGENSNGRAAEPVFKVKRKSKKGEALMIKFSDLSPLFGLHVSYASKELGISTTSLKKAHKHLGLHRWPGRKVRGLESAIDRLKRTIVGQGADSGNKVARMRSKIPKLQQELDELFHGTPAQVTKIMHSRKRKKEVPPCTIDPIANQPTLNAGQESPSPSSRKYIQPSRRPILRSSLRLGSKDTEMKANDLEGLSPEVHGTINMAGREVLESVVQTQNGNIMLTPKTEIGEEGTEDRGVAVEKGATIAERSAKRPKLESL